MKRRTVVEVAAVAVVLLQTAACSNSSETPSGPTASPLPLAAESGNFRYYYSPSDGVEIERQEAFHTWAIARLGIAVPQKIDYRKYTSRQDMGARTGAYNTNAYAEPGLFTIHTLLTWDNHETVHIYSALIGLPSEFFNEGIAVAFQTDPMNGRFEPWFNGEQVHDSVRTYRQLGQLALPLSRIVTTSGFRAVSDSVLSYREAGSFVAFLIDRFGLDRVLAFFRASTRDDALSVIELRFQQALGTALGDAEGEWLAFVG
jgi:hypothetical protein